MIWPVIIAVIVFILSLWRPRFGVAAVIVLLPSYLIRTTIHGVPTTALELAIYALAFGVLIDAVRRKQGFRSVYIPRTWLVLFTVWALGWIISTIASTDRTASLGALKAWVIDPNIFAIVVLYVIRTAEEKLLLMTSILFSGLAVSIAGFVQMVAFHSTLQDGRLSSFFHPVANYAAMYLGPIFIIGFALLLYKVLRGWLWWAAVGLIGLAILLTVSFAGYFAMAAGVIVLWLWLPKGKLKQRLGLGALTAALLAGLIIPQTKYFSEHFNTTDRSSGLVRSQIWVTSWAMIQHSPIVGIGPNTFEANYRLEVPKHYWPPLEWLVAQPHNLYVALWLETGLAGLMVFLGFIAHWARLVWQKSRQADEAQHAIMLAGLAAMIAILVHGLFDTPYFKNDLAVEFGLIVLLPWIGQEKFLKE